MQWWRSWSSQKRSGQTPDWRSGGIEAFRERRAQAQDLVEHSFVFRVNAPRTLPPCLFLWNGTRATVGCKPGGGGIEVERAVWEAPARETGCRDRWDPRQTG